ncbi:MAG: hypothetical protein JO086_02330 [Acidimicrobiia bacterium]|nr:hypothetical protein [Acidimicrobiia bacterium]
MNARGLDADAARKLNAAGLLAVEAAPYLAAALFRVYAVAAPGLGTFAVDRGWRLYVDPDALGRWGPKLAAGVLLHEVSHLLRDHGGRQESHGAYDNELWNLAADATINADLVTAGITLPEGCVVPETLGLGSGELAETYYDALLSRFPDRQEEACASAHGPSAESESAGAGTDASGDAPGTGDGTCGSGAGGVRRAWELDDADSAAPALGPEAADLIRRRVAQEVVAHKGRGTVPGGWERWAEHTLAPPVVPWRQVLASAVRRAVAWRAGQVDYTYRRPGRRRLPRVVMPAMHRPVPTVAVVVDTSGSMGADELAAAMSEVQGVSRAVGVRGRGLQVLAVDAAVQSVSVVCDPSRIELKGGGGTDMRVGIAAAEKLQPRPGAVVVLTDGFTPWPTEPTTARLVCALIGGADSVEHARRSYPPPSWATVIEVVDAAAAA